MVPGSSDKRAAKKDLISAGIARFYASSSYYGLQVAIRRADLFSREIALHRSPT